MEIEDPLKTNQVANLMPLFERDGKRLLYEKKLYIPIYSVSHILQIAHDSKTGGHFEEGSRRKEIDRAEFSRGTGETVRLTWNGLHGGSPEDEESFRLYCDVGGSLITKSLLHSVKGK